MRLIYWPILFLLMNFIPFQARLEGLLIQYLSVIVEGSTGLTNAEFRRFLVIANRSALEVVGCLYLARRRGYLGEEKFTELYNRVELLVKMIQALINTLND